MPILQFRIADYKEPTPEEAAILKRHVREPHRLDKDLRYHTFEGDPIALLAECPSMRLEVMGAPLPVTMWEEILDRLRKIEALVLKAPAPEAAFNAKCNVHIPGIGLLLIDEVDVVPDACTEDIRKRLEEGWRILAICPQPDQRRPDYILGRQKV